MPLCLMGVDANYTARVLEIVDIVHMCVICISLYLSPAESRHFGDIHTAYIHTYTLSVLPCEHTSLLHRAEQLEHVQLEAERLRHDG